MIQMNIAVYRDGSDCLIRLGFARRLERSRKDTGDGIRAASRWLLARFRYHLQLLGADVAFGFVP